MKEMYEATTRRKGHAFKKDFDNEQMLDAPYSNKHNEGKLASAPGASLMSLHLIDFLRNVSSSFSKGHHLLREREAVRHRFAPRKAVSIHTRIRCRQSSLKIRSSIGISDGDYRLTLLFRKSSSLGECCNRRSGERGRGRGTGGKARIHSTTTYTIIKRRGKNVLFLFKTSQICVMYNIYFCL